MQARLPENEPERLEALRSIGILDTPPEANFDGAAALASLICGTPIALVTLVDQDRQWFKANIGLGVPETHRDASFCAHAILERRVFEVADAALDERFHDNPLVLGDPKIRFYAGAPLVDRSGLAMGTLCVIDRKPRELSSEQRQALAGLAAMVTTEMRLRAAHRALEKSLEALSGPDAPDEGQRQSRVNELADSLRTPLTPVFLQIAVLRKSVGGEKAARSFDAITRNLQRLEAAINQTLQYTWSEGASDAVKER